MKSVILFLLIFILGCSNSNSYKYYMEVSTRDPKDNSILVRLYEMESNSRMKGVELEKNFYCVYFLNEEPYLKQPASLKVIGATVSCQPCHQNENCSSEQAMSVKELDGTSQLELGQNSDWWHKIKFVRFKDR
jgi:hypothetical protein